MIKGNDLVSLLIKGKYWKAFMPLKIVNIMLWIFVMLFALNTVGNILAETTFEKSFAVLTFVSALLICFIMVKGKKNNNPTKSNPEGIQTECSQRLVKWLLLVFRTLVPFS